MSDETNQQDNTAPVEDTPVVQPLQELIASIVAADPSIGQENIDATIASVVDHPDVIDKASAAAAVAVIDANPAVTDEAAIAAVTAAVVSVSTASVIDNAVADTVVSTIVDAVASAPAVEDETAAGDTVMTVAAIIDAIHSDPVSDTTIDAVAAAVETPAVVVEEPVEEAVTTQPTEQATIDAVQDATTQADTEQAQPAAESVAVEQAQVAEPEVVVEETPVAVDAPAVQADQSQAASDAAVITGDNTAAPEAPAVVEEAAPVVVEQAAEAPQEVIVVQKSWDATYSNEAPVVVQVEQPAPTISINPVPFAISSTPIIAPVVTTEPIVAPVISTDPQQAVIDTVKFNGSVSGKTAIAALEDYVNCMKPGIPLESKEGARHQEHLWRTLSNLIDSDTEDFNEVFRAVLALVHREGRAAFAETHLFRFTENIALGHAQTKAFLALLDLIKVTADPKGRFLALKQVDFHRSTEHYWSERARQRLTNFYNL